MFGQLAEAIRHGPPDGPLWVDLQPEDMVRRHAEGPGETGQFLRGWAPLLPFPPIDRLPIRANGLGQFFLGQAQPFPRPSNPPTPARQIG